MTFGVRIDGIREAQQATLRAANAAKPGGAMSAAIKAATLEAQRQAVVKTHVDTGALRASHLVRIAKTQGEVYINPSARRSDGGRPAKYGPFEHARGGSHAFYKRAMDEGASAISTAASGAFSRYLR